MLNTNKIYMHVLPIVSNTRTSQNLKTKKLQSRSINAVPNKNNVVLIRPFLPVQEVNVHLRKNNALANGWGDHMPFINALSKVFYKRRGGKPICWMAVLTKELSVLDYELAVPKKSLIFKYITSSNPERQKTLEACEKILVDAYASAKEFLNEDDKNNVQSGFLVVGDKDLVMSSLGMFGGIEISYEEIDNLIDAIEDNDPIELDDLKGFFKGTFVHEMVHALQKERIEGEEIATHACQILSTEADNPFINDYFLDYVEKPSDSYEKDILASLKVLKQKLSQTAACLYKPRNHELIEINRAIKSIPEKKRERVLKKIAREMELLT